MFMLHELFQYESKFESDSESEFESITLSLCRF